jgi:glutathione S-transferase
MTTYTLHCFKESGNSYKVALALTLAGLPWNKVDVDYFNGETRTAAWRASVNELGEVPVLDVGTDRMTQSGAILMSLADHIAMYGLERSERAKVLRWILFDNHKFTANLASYRWLRTFASPAPDESVLTYMRGRAAGAVDILERHLQARSFVVGERLTIADVSMAGYVFYPKEELDFDFLADYPNIAAWMARLSQTPGWKAPYELLA